MIGWVVDIAAASAYYANVYGFNATWTALSSNDKTAALTTAYNRIRYSREVSLPLTPTVDQLAVLAYAQQEYAQMIVYLADGGIRREAAISQGITSAGIISESYDINASGKLPSRILDILDAYKTGKYVYTYDLYRDETDNPAHTYVYGDN
jgi:hypothetical protein